MRNVKKAIPKDNFLNENLQTFIPMVEKLNTRNFTQTQFPLYYFKKLRNYW